MPTSCFIYLQDKEFSIIMRFMIITPRHIRAAREAVGWSQGILAKRAGISQATISSLEGSAGRDGQVSTLAAIENAFASAGVFFTPNGIEWRTGSTYTISGPGWWLRVLDDVEETLSKGGEVVLLFADDRESSPEVVSKWRELRSAGVRMRKFIREDNRFLLGPVDEYRWMPKDKFENRITLLYGDKIAVCAEDNSKAVVIKDQGLALSWRCVVDVLWGALEQPDRSIADVQF